MTLLEQIVLNFHPMFQLLIADKNNIIAITDDWFLTNNISKRRYFSKTGDISEIELPLSKWYRDLYNTYSNIVMGRHIAYGFEPR